MDGIEIIKKKRKLMREFIELYESYPCLWHVKSPQYHNRDARAKAYKVLIQKLRVMNPDADRATVVKKINGLRSNVRKEHRKILEYSKAGKVYKPNLWYYHLFSFLKGMNRQPPPESEGSEDVKKIKTEDKTKDPLDWWTGTEESNPAENALHDDEMVTVTDDEEGQPRYEVETLDVEGPSQRVSTKCEPKTTNSRTLEDRHDIFGHNVAMKLRYLSTKSDTQRLMAENIINQALYMAEMGLLTMEHCKVLK